MTPQSNLGLNVLKSLSQFFDFISTKLELISSDSQMEMVSLITACIKHFNDQKIDEKVEESEEFKSSITKIIEAYKIIFKNCIKMRSIDSLKVFADRYELVNVTESNYICRTFCRTVEYFKESPELIFIYLKLTISLSQKNLQSAKPVDSSNLILFLQIYNRHFIKYKQHSKHDITATGLGLILGATAMIKNSLNNTESSSKLLTLLDELFEFLSENLEIVDEMLNQNLFHGMDLFYFKEIQIMSKLNLVKCMKKCVAKHLINGHEGILLSSQPDSQNLLEIFMKIVYGDFSELNPTDLNLSSQSDLMQLEIFSKCAAQFSIGKSIDALLQLCSQSFFIAEPGQHVKFMNLLKIALLSLTSDGLTEVIERFLNSAGYLNVSSLLLLSCFPFSLWRSLDKHTTANNSISELSNIWKFLLANESSIDLLPLVLSAASNLINEAVDIIKKEELKQVLSLLPESLALIRNDNSTTPILKHRLSTAMHKLLRSLLCLRDDKVIDIIDSISKLGSTDSCVCLFDTWKSLSLFSFVKHSRDTTKLNNTIKDRINMIIPKLFPAINEKMSPGAKLMIQHYYRHALYLHMRYTQDVGFFNNPIIKTETDSLMNYIQDSSLSWSKGMFNHKSEDLIWEFIYSNMPNPTDSMQIQAQAIPLRISSPTTFPATLNLLKDDFIALQRLIEDLKERRDNSSLLALHNNLQSILKLK